MSTDSKKSILAFVKNDELKAVIAEIVSTSPFDIFWIHEAHELGEKEFEPNLPGERLKGQDGNLQRKLSHEQPALLIFDLDNEAIPADWWIAVTKTSPATRRIPVIAFGNHENLDSMAKARAAGAEAVIARVQLAKRLAGLIETHATVIDESAVSSACSEPLADLGVSGIEAFNRGEYYACHDDLEEAWRADSSDVRDLYKGILQVGIAYFQIERGNYRGAVKMFLRVHQWLDALPDTCRGVDIAALRKNSYENEAQLLDLGEENISAFDFSKIQPIFHSHPTKEKSMSPSDYVPDRALFIFAHPDDIEFACAGTAAHWVKNGATVHYIVITDGNIGTDDLEMTQERLATIRRKEQTAAAEHVGASVTFLGYPDGMLVPDLKLRKDLVREIRRHKPNVVLCGDPTSVFPNETRINHPDHRAAATAAIDAVFPSADSPLLFPDLMEEGFMPHKVNFVYIRSSDPKTANTYIDISEVIDLKVEALRMHECQLGDWDPDGPLKEWASGTGKRVGFAYAEAYRRITLNE